VIATLRDCNPAAKAVGRAAQASLSRNRPEPSVSHTVAR
jgi:hypothetical protein